MVYFYVAPDTSAAAIKAALSRSLCPADAIVQADATTGLVRIQSETPWRLDKKGNEDGIGVPGWGLQGSELSGVQKGADEALAEAKVIVRTTAPIDVKAASVNVNVNAKAAAKR